MTFEFKPSLEKKMELINGRIYEYEIFKIQDEYSTHLKTPTIPWDFTYPPTDLKYIAASMIKTMVRKHGIGLSANQCGLPWSIFCMGGLGKYVEFIINPVILETDGRVNEQEGCLSSPGLFLMINRAKKIKVEYFDLGGQKKTQELDGLSARVFQHEFDHLRGVRYQDLVTSIALERAKKDVKKNLKKMQAVIEQNKKAAPPSAVEVDTTTSEKVEAPALARQVVDTSQGVQYIIKM